MRPYDTLGILEDSTYSLRIGSSGAFHDHLGYQRCDHIILGQFSRSWFSHKLELLILIERIGLMITGNHSWESPNIGLNLNIICKIYFIQSKMLFSYCWWRCFKICKFRPTYLYLIIINVFLWQKFTTWRIFWQFWKKK
jgi:hypothetical protein